MTDLRKAAEMMAYEVPLHELLEGVPEDARLVIDSEDGMSTRFIPVGHLCKRAAEALRQALAQPVDAVNMSQECVDETAKREHEPVAWADKVGAVIPHSHKLFQPDLLKDYTRPLYTAPPKREWVGLTDADKQEAFDETQEASGGFWEFADYLEAKLKEKNT